MFPLIFLVTLILLVRINICPLSTERAKVIFTKFNGMKFLSSDCLPSGERPRKYFFSQFTPIPGSLTVIPEYTQSQKKRTMNSLASPCDPGSSSSHPSQIIFDHRNLNKVHLSTLFPKRNATFHGAFLLRLSVHQYISEN